MLCQAGHGRGPQLCHKGAKFLAWARRPVVGGMNALVVADSVQGRPLFRALWVAPLVCCHVPAWALLVLPAMSPWPPRLLSALGGASAHRPWALLACRPWWCL
jgi:hypothetical protein